METDKRRPTHLHVHVGPTTLHVTPETFILFKAAVSYAYSSSVIR